MKRLFVGVLAAVTLAVPSSGTSTVAASFADAVGDAGGAPDIVTVNVTNNARGDLNVLVFFLGAVAPPADVQVTLVLDTDRNQATGSRGADYVFQFDALENTHGVGRWDGAQFAIVGAPTAEVAWSGLTVSFEINRSDLGGTNGFDFWIRAHQSPPDSDLIDDAPNEGTWTYELTTPQASRVVFPQTLKARAGKVFDARTVRVQLTDGTRAAAERLTCRLTSGGARLEQLAGGCRWRIPARLRGKPLVLAVVAAYGDAQLRATRRFIVGR